MMASAVQQEFCYMQGFPVACGIWLSEGCNKALSDTLYTSQNKFLSMFTIMISQGVKLK